MEAVLKTPNEVIDALGGTNKAAARLGGQSVAEAQSHSAGAVSVSQQCPSSRWQISRAGSVRDGSPGRWRGGGVVTNWWLVAFGIVAFGGVLVAAFLFSVRDE
jgi:hypothetical protein